MSDEGTNRGPSNAHAEFDPEQMKQDIKMLEDTLSRESLFILCLGFAVRPVLISGTG